MQIKTNGKWMLALSLFAFGGCARSLVITNATGEAMKMTRTTGSQQHEIMLEPGDRMAVPLGHEINISGVLIEVR
jgi:hypothetical protein